MTPVPFSKRSRFQMGCSAAASIHPCRSVAAFGLAEAVVALLVGTLLLAALVQGLMQVQGRGRRWVTGPDGADWPVAPDTLAIASGAELQQRLASLASSGAVAAVPLSGGRPAFWRGEAGLRLPNDTILFDGLALREAGVVTAGNGGDLLWWNPGGGTGPLVSARLRIVVTDIGDWRFEEAALEMADGQRVACRVARAIEEGARSETGIHPLDREDWNPLSGGSSGAVLVVCPDPWASPTTGSNGYAQVLETHYF